VDIGIRETDEDVSLNPKKKDSGCLIRVGFLLSG
jgi:hypothetical protein